jgi:hypothetical protein
MHGQPVTRPELDRRLGKCVGDNALIKKAATSPLAAITCPSSRLYINLPETFIDLNWIN